MGKNCFKDSGTIYYISNNVNILKHIESSLDKEEISSNISIRVISVFYKSILELKNIMNIIEKTLNKKDKKDLLCAFNSESTLETLNGINTFYGLYQQLNNNKIIELINNGELFSVMQPIYDIQNKSLFGYEFLLRGKINGEIVPPLEIYETAHELGLQHLLDSRALTVNLEKASTLLNENVKIFINFLPSIFNNPEFNMDNTFEIASNYKVPLTNLVFEVVETENIKDLESLNSLFVFYKQNGTMFAMDDVGAGYSSLNNLHKLLPDYVKIDRELISFCDQNKDKFRIIESIVNLCKNLNIVILAEGLERVEELNVCKSLGINLGQGYLLGRPSEDEVINNFIFE